MAHTLKAWQQRRFSSKPGSETTAPTAAAVSTVSEKDCSTAATETAARATAVVKTVQCLAQAAMPAAKGAATAAPSTAAATPPRGWVLEPRNGLVVMARSPRRQFVIQMLPEMLISALLV